MNNWFEPLQSESCGDVFATTEDNCSKDAQSWWQSWCGNPSTNVTTSWSSKPPPAPAAAAEKAAAEKAAAAKAAAEKAAAAAQAAANKAIKDWQTAVADTANYTQQSNFDHFQWMVGGNTAFAPYAEIAAADLAKAQKTEAAAKANMCKLCAVAGVQCQIKDKNGNLGPLPSSTCS